ncbi:MAG: MgtC/SapB family protein [Halofilum sp. (in: g-proteobacteria)]|nr:MgtC/SapB family protein [Halofilum sp. (in: g-proteobacteria)]
MATDDILIRLLVALFAGLLIGAERGWARRSEEEGRRPAGIRTFGLIGLAGGLWALLGAQLGAVVLGFAAAVLGAMLAVVYWLQVRDRQNYSLTTEVAALVTFALGAIALEGHLVVAAAGAVVTAALLGLKPPLHGWLQRITRLELHGALKLLLVSVVVLPVLPDRGYGPWEALNPYTIWWMVVLIAGIGFVGYVAVRLLGARYGLLLTGFAAGLMASTPLALAYARIARERPQHAGVLAAAILAASSTMFPRALAVASVLAPSLFAHLAAPMLAMMAAGYATAAFWWLRESAVAEGAEAPIRNPFELLPALQFGLLLAVVTVLAHALERWVGESGLYALAFVSGLTDVDAITLSLVGFVDDGLAVTVVANGIVIAAMANTGFKAALVLTVGGRVPGLRVVASVLVVLLAGATALAV